MQILKKRKVVKGKCTFIHLIYPKICYTSVQLYFQGRLPANSSHRLCRVSRISSMQNGMKTIKAVVEHFLTPNYRNRMYDEFLENRTLYLLIFF